MVYQKKLPKSSSFFTLSSMVRTRATISATSTNPVVDAPAPIDPQPSQTSADNNNNRAQSPAPPPVQQTQPDHRNSQPWHRDFKISIGARNKTPFLEGTLPQPPPNDSLFGSWIRCNQMVMSWILHSVSPEIKSSIMYLDTVAEMWTVLHNRFNQGNGPRIFELNETLTYLHQGEDSVSSYFTKLAAI
uniref:Retrotransposon gag domain-containing protein n=1 Tax=Cannabis sativa TaxID=3483 RepID=A0A803QH45_CANSA